MKKIVLFLGSLIFVLSFLLLGVQAKAQHTSKKVMLSDTLQINWVLAGITEKLECDTVSNLDLLEAFEYADSCISSIEIYYEKSYPKIQEKRQQYAYLLEKYKIQKE